MKAMRAVLAAMALWAAPAGAQDAMQGRELAERWCANCHRVTASGPGPTNDAAPAFSSIAARSGVTADGISTFLRTPHATMPDHGLTLRQSQDLAAYVLSQRPR
jgi:mono/diheme cytochrome c family protein